MNKVLCTSLCVILSFGCGVEPKDISFSESEVLAIKGTANFAGSDLPLELFIDPQGKFLVKIGGWADQVTGYDGERLWRIENGVGPYEIEFFEKEFIQIFNWILIKNWKTFEKVNLSKDILQLSGGLLKVSLAYTDGALSSLNAFNSPYQESISLKGLLQQNSVSIPKEVFINWGFSLKSYHFKSVEKILKSAGIFEKPNYRADNVSFNKEISPQIKVRKTKSGHLFVRPTIQGEDVGWFLFDSGAGVSLLDPKIAKKFNFPIVGEKSLGGIGGHHPGKQSIMKGKNIRLGPLVMGELNFVELNPMMSMANQVLGEPAAGVLGWDILLRAVLEVDMLEGTISVHDPNEFKLEERYSKALYLHWNVPYVESEFEGGKKGLFMLDTGAGNHGPIFHSLAVDRLDLLEGRETKKGIMHGAGGEVTVENGKLDWFEIAGNRTDNVPSVFMRGDDGEADLYTEGFLGGYVIQSLKVVFDYPGKKVGFVPKGK